MIPRPLWEGLSLGPSWEVELLREVGRDEFVHGLPFFGRIHQIKRVLVARQGVVLMLDVRFPESRHELKEKPGFVIPKNAFVYQEAHLFRLLDGNSGVSKPVKHKGRGKGEVI